MFRIIIFITSFLQSSVSIIVVVVDDNEQSLKLYFIPQSLMPGTHLFCVYGDNWFQSVRYTLRCLVAVNKEASCVQTIQSTEEKLAEKKKALESFQGEFCEVKKKYDEAKERLENDVKEITELIKE